jgi:hypothetical protein
MCPTSEGRSIVTSFVDFHRLNIAAIEATREPASCFWRDASLRDRRMVRPPTVPLQEAISLEDVIARLERATLAHLEPLREHSDLH